MKVAVVGAGISGLVAARGLACAHELVVFEAAEWLGGHTHTVDVDIGGRSIAVDTGFIVYNEPNYPGFSRLLDELGVATRTTTMSFSVSCVQTGVEWSSESLASVFAQRRNAIDPAFLGFLRSIMRFNEAARQLLEHAPGSSDGLTLAAFLARHRFSRRLIDHYVVPMGAAIWSTPPGQVLEFPARAYAQFFANHGLLSVRDQPTWRVIEGGSRRYVEALVAPFRQAIRMRCPVVRIARKPRAVELTLGSGETESFDAVVLAVHSDQALSMLAAPTDAERELLGAIRYQANDVVLHTDARLMPSNRRAWASWNVHLDATRAADPVAVTYDMNRLQGLDVDASVCVTLNRTDAIDPACVLGRYRYAHPVFDHAALAAQRERARLSGVDRIHYCGAWWGWGFHEDGFRSGAEVCRELGVDA